ncbi:MAG: hypothetical protein HXX08_08500 [Chloroflexi bacterium]|uniref:Uncharacterized protein n=1 Tax=Candidatus Chlorohelix allophototropha TaxID=3003348 RepID=A0A8T7LV47_9CHLR|nr:hypothetical protein [Chloroflexota bacterium]WJW67765.1 hypothetical protein OZ401_001044 [Chloroflexota bacterium L227-S17]
MVMEEKTESATANKRNMAEVALIILVILFTLVAFGMCIGATFLSMNTLTSNLPK